jgi:hypothetical protein
MLNASSPRTHFLEILCVHAVLKFHSSTLNTWRILTTFVLCATSWIYIPSSIETWIVDIWIKLARMFILVVTKSTRIYLRMTWTNGYIIKVFFVPITLFRHASSLSMCNLQVVVELRIYHRHGLGNIELKWHDKMLDEGMQLRRGCQCQLNLLTKCNGTIRVEHVGRAVKCALYAKKHMIYKCFLVFYSKSRPSSMFVHVLMRIPT